MSGREKKEPGRRLFPLVSNELKKIFKQKSFRVMGILLLAAALLLPLMMSGLDALVGKAGRLEVSEDQRTADLYAKNGEYVSEAFFRGRYQGEQFFSDHRLEDSLEHSIYLGDLQEAYITRNLLEVLSSGRSDYASMASGSLYCDYINNCYFRIRPEERAAIDYEGAANRTDPETEYLKERITNDTVTLMLNSTLSEISNIENAVLTFSISDYYKELKTRAESQIRHYKAEASGVRDSYVPDARSKEVLELSVEWLGYYTEALDIAAEGSSGYLSWQYRTVEMINSVAGRANDVVPLDRDSFSSVEFMISRYGSYEKYLDALEKTRAEYESAMKTGLFSLRKNAPLREAFDSSSRTLFHYEIGAIVSFSAIVAVLIAAISITSEFSSGTVRLLLIRPWSRKKILASKLIALAIVWGALIAASYLILLAVNGILGAGNDFFFSDIYRIGGTDIKVNFLFSSLFTLFLSTLPVLPVVALAVFFSVLTNRAPLAIIIPIGLSVISETVQMISTALISMGIGFLRFTPFPYSNLTVYMSAAAGKYFQTDSLSLGSILSQAMTGAMLGDSGVRYLPLLGVFYMRAAAAALIWAVFPIFKKQEIKS